MSIYTLTKALYLYLSSKFSDSLTETSNAHRSSLTSDSWKGRVWFFNLQTCELYDLWLLSWCRSGLVWNSVLCTCSTWQLLRNQHVIVYKCIFLSLNDNQFFSAFCVNCLLNQCIIQKRASGVANLLIFGVVICNYNCVFLNRSWWQVRDKERWTGGSRERWQKETSSFISHRFGCLGYLESTNLFQIELKILRRRWLTDRLHQQPPGEPVYRVGLAFPLPKKDVAARWHTAECDEVIPHWVHNVTSHTSRLHGTSTFAAAICYCLHHPCPSTPSRYVFSSLCLVKTHL